MGVRQDEFRADTTSLSRLYSYISYNDPAVMFFHAHHPVQDPVSPQLYWGLREYVTNGERAGGVPVDIVGQDQDTGELLWAFKLSAKNGVNMDFFKAYDALIGLPNTPDHVRP